MKLRPALSLVWDLETDGLLPELTKIHILVIKDVESGQRWVFHKNKHEDNILEGIEMLNNAGMLIGHNIVGFDMKALWKVYGDRFAPTGIIRDTMVMARMLFADEKERDFRRWHREELDGKYIGSHELAAWGQRLGYPKGDYSDVKKEQLKAENPELAKPENKKELNRLVWEHWSQEMEDYAIQDVEVTMHLWKKCAEKPWSDFATILEHEVHGLMERVQENGFPLNIEAAQELENSLRETRDRLAAEAEAHFGDWWVPSRWLKVNDKKCVSYVIPATGNKEKNLPSFAPRKEFFEDDSRERWGEVQVPKRTTKFKPIIDKETGEVRHKGDTEAGCPFCPVEVKEFNPNSRTMIVDRLKKMYDWVPQEMTEEGNPKVDDDVLRDLAKTVPICDPLAEIFYYSKRLGQLVDGKNGLIGKAMERGDGRVHARTNTGGTITNRASHSNPNIAQVPRVVFKLLKQWNEPDAVYGFAKGKITYGRMIDGQYVEGGLTPRLNPDTGEQFLGVPMEHGVNCGCYPSCEKPKGEFIRDDEGKIKTKKTLMKGRAGDHGWDFRNLFVVPKGWKLMGADQKGIELRALGHYMAEFDQGQYLRLVIEADPHDLHQSAMELDSRDTAKTFIYAMIYGAQDYKLGITIDPGLAFQPQRAMALGKEMRRRLMVRIPALGQVIRAVQTKQRRGYVDALDGRLLYVRAKHSALNTLLQGAAATVAKLWCVYFEQFCEEDGLKHGWDGDFVILAWVHDELQIAVRDDPRCMMIVEKNIKEAAASAGERLHFRSPVDIDTKFGMTWAQTH